jgi:hypothetical protein
MDRESVLLELVIAFTPVAAAEMKLEDHEVGAIPRWPFEIVEVRREEGLSLRLLPDGGGGSPICGDVVSVRPGDEQYLLEVLDSPAPRSSCPAWSVTTPEIKVESLATSRRL